MKIKVGAQAPSFSLPDEAGKMHTLAEYAGSYVLLYFYPKDDTPGCTKEACAIRDTHPQFGKLKAKVFGISADSVESHAKFKKKYTLPFSLLSDTEKKVINAYGVWGKKKFMGREYLGITRTSFLVDPKGKIAKIYESVKPDLHADEVLADLKTLSSKKT